MKDYIITGIIILLIFCVVGFLGWAIINSIWQPEQIGSVQIANEYHATTTSNIGGALLHTERTQHLVNYSEYQPTILGSIIIASTTGHSFTIWNATTTPADYANSSTTLAVFPANAPQGTYTFDAVLTNGLVVDMEAGFSGDFIITFR